MYDRGVGSITPEKELDLDRYKGCSYAIWASTPAILWTAERPQEVGIHVHVHDGHERVEDDTFGVVTLNGKALSRVELIEQMLARTLA